MGERITSIRYHGEPIQQGDSSYGLSLLVDADFFEVKDLPGPYQIDIIPQQGNVEEALGVTIRFISDATGGHKDVFLDEKWLDRIEERVRCVEDNERSQDEASNTKRSAQHNESAGLLQDLLLHNGVTLSGKLRDGIERKDLREGARDLFGAIADLMAPLMRMRQGIVASRSDEQQR